MGSISQFAKLHQLSKKTNLPSGNVRLTLVSIP